MAAVAATGIFYLPAGAHQRLSLFGLTPLPIELDPTSLASALYSPLLYNGALLPWFVTATFTRWL
jgi:hypothetical protein